jgi:hypothetical protein
MVLWWIDCRDAPVKAPTEANKWHKTGNSKMCDVFDQDRDFYFTARMLSD